MKKIAVVNCYHDPDYVRARSLRAAVRRLPGCELIVVKNRHTGLLRYPEIVIKLLRCRLRERPDAYLLTFRGQEILPFCLLIAGRKPLWFDEFIVPSAYAKNEKHKKSFGIVLKHTLARLGEPLYNFCLRRCEKIISDTESHAELSARVSRINLRKYLAIPVSTDEKSFKPKVTASSSGGGIFQVFYYTTGMQPLHGVPHVLEAAKLLSSNANIQFYLVGGKKPMERAVNKAKKDGARIVYDSWVGFDELPKIMRSSGLVLGGPFGQTKQAEHVITGKTYQAVASASPVLIGANRETERYFVDKDNCLMVSLGNAEAIAEAITWAYENSKQLEQIAAKGRRLYEKRFSNDAISTLLQPLAEDIN